MVEELGMDIIDPKLVIVIEDEISEFEGKL